MEKNNLKKKKRLIVRAVQGFTYEREQKRGFFFGEMCKRSGRHYF